MLRNDLTISEARLWGGIKNRATGARFRRQVPIGVWIVDFASLKPKLVVEVDDTSHHWRDEIDRTEHLESLGYTILRFDNEDIATDVDLVIGTVEHWVKTLLATGSPPE
jgi:very-short-patch-repair endonuclease